jgi:PPOX class probable F420-dependent enzyme
VAAVASHLDSFARVAALGHHLGVLSTLRGDGTIQSSLVSVGVLDHPVDRRPVVGLVARGGTRKLHHLRARPTATVVAQADFEWVAVEGDAHLAGPDDPRAGVDGERLRSLLREVFEAAGGTHDDWPTYDRVMAEERRTVVLITPRRVYSNR